MIKMTLQLKPKEETFDSIKSLWKINKNCDFGIVRHFTTANVVKTHAVVYPLVTGGICMYSC